MALIACRECGAQISDNAAACPKCGKPQMPAAVSRGIGLYAIAVVGAIVVLVVLAIALS